MSQVSATYSRPKPLHVKYFKTFEDAVSYRLKYEKVVKAGADVDVVVRNAASPPLKNSRPGVNFDMPEGPSQHNRNNTLKKYKYSAVRT